MKKKTLFSALMALVLVFSLVACGGTASTPSAQPEQTASSQSQEVRTHEGTSGITLRLAWLGDGQNKDALDACLAKYTEQTGIGVEAVFIPGTWYEYFTKIQTMIAGGERIDAAFVAIEGFEMFVDMGMAKPIDDWIAANPDTYNAVASDVDENVVQFMNFEGKQYGIPCEWNNVVTHFNTKLLAEAGLELPGEDWNKDQFLEYAQKLTKDKEDGTKQYGVAVPGYYFGFEAWLYNNGTSFMNEDMTESRLTDPKTVEMFQFAQDLIYKYQYAPVPDANVDSIQQLIDGNLGMGFWGRWPTTKYVASDFKDVGIQYVPNWSQNQVIWGGAGVFTLAQSPDPDEATNLAIYLSSEPFISEFMQSGAIPVLNSVAKEVVPALGFPENNALFFESAELAVPVQAPVQYAESAELIERALNDILRDQADVQTTLEAADKELNLILSENK